MIYQLKIYYGALIKDKAVYSAELTFDDCTELLTEPVDCETIKSYLIEKIIEDGFNPNDFAFDYLTKEQFESKIESKCYEEIVFE
jgi:hypothetical protein